MHLDVFLLVEIVYLDAILLLNCVPKRALIGSPLYTVHLSLQVLQDRPEPVYEEYVRRPGQHGGTHPSPPPGLGQDRYGGTRRMGQ